MTVPTNVLQAGLIWNIGRGTAKYNESCFRKRGGRLPPGNGYRQHIEGRRGLGANQVGKRYSRVECILVDGRRSGGRGIGCGSTAEYCDDSELTEESLAILNKGQVSRDDHFGGHAAVHDSNHVATTTPSPIYATSSLCLLLLLI